VEVTREVETVRVGTLVSVDIRKDWQRPPTSTDERVLAPRDVLPTRPKLARFDAIAPGISTLFAVFKCHGTGCSAAVWTVKIRVLP
jgi:hypothetical protein